MTKTSVPCDPTLRRRTPDDDIISVVITDLKSITRTATLDFTLRVGELVFLRIYGGDLGVLRRRKSKHASFRRLAAHPDLPFSAATLWRAVAIFELAQRVPITASQLGVAHLRSVLGLPDDVQARLLSDAIQHEWTKEETERHAAVYRKATPQRGRPPTPPALKMVTAVERLARSISGSLPPPASSEARLELDTIQAARAREAVKRLREICDVVEDALTR
jgi:hypothetical protein